MEGGVDSFAKGSTTWGSRPTPDPTTYNPTVNKHYQLYLNNSMNLDKQDLHNYIDQILDLRDLDYFEDAMEEEGCVVVGQKCCKS